MRRTLVLVALSLMGCTSKVEGNSEKPKRMFLVDTTELGGQGYSIIKVDGHEYITTSRGGIVHSEHCKETEHLQK